MTNHKSFGRPKGTGKYGTSYTKTYRLSPACIQKIEDLGGRECLESLVPDTERQELTDKYYELQKQKKKKKK